jgi:peptidoglycan/LPS O-acetylase OafA/YrhL
MPSKSYLSSLTALRGIAALGVVLFHVDAIWIPLWTPNTAFFLRKGYLLVDFFFLLSGFIMVHVYGETFVKAPGWTSFRKFIQARFARIYPLHFISLVLLILYFYLKIYGKPLGFLDVYIFDLKMLPANFLLLHGMGLNPFFSWNVPSWSISTEWWMYMLFPLLMMGFGKINLWKGLGIFVLVMGIYLICYYVLYPISVSHSPLPNNRGYSLDMTYDFAFFRCFAGFVLGMLVYEVFRTGWMEKVFGSEILLLLTTAVIFISMQFPWAEYVVILLFAGLLLMVSHNSGWTRRFLESGPMKFLGDISYSVYLMHMVVMVVGLSFFENGWTPPPGPVPPLVWVGVYVLATLLVSWFTYRWVEVPLRHWLGPKK